jgi:hypothetical protein
VRELERVTGPSQPLVSYHAPFAGQNSSPPRPRAGPIATPRRRALKRVPSNVAAPARTDRHRDSVRTSEPPARSHRSSKPYPRRTTSQTHRIGGSGLSRTPPCPPTRTRRPRTHSPHQRRLRVEQYPVPSAVHTCRSTSRSAPESPTGIVATCSCMKLRSLKAARPLENEHASGITHTCAGERRLGAIVSSARTCSLIPGSRSATGSTSRTTCPSTPVSRSTTTFLSVRARCSPMIGCPVHMASDGVPHQRDCDGVRQ